MSGEPNVPAGRDEARELKTRLAEAERLVGAVRAEVSEGDQAAARHAMRDLEQAAAAAPAEARRLARRLQRVRARHALLARQVPAGALDGLYEAVRARTDAEGPDLVLHRAGMSRAFLDAPRSLVLWRRAALAACALLALGVGWLTASRPGPQPQPAAPAGSDAVSRTDPRDELLRRLEPDSPPQSGGLIQTVGWPRTHATPERAPMIFTPRAQRDVDAGRLLDAIRRAPARRPAKDRDVEQH